MVLSSKYLLQLQSWLALIAVMVAPLAAIAQAGRGDWAAVRQLASGTEVEVRATGSKSMGRIRSVTDLAIELDVNGRVVDVSRSDVERVYRLGGKDRKKGAAIGAAIGGGAGIGAGVGIYAQGDFIGGVVPIFGAIGAGIGAGIGALVGRGKKELIYQR